MDCYNITMLWKRHYVSGVTGSYHGDMARAYAAMLDDPECDRSTASKMRGAINIHMHAERHPAHTGRHWFCERLGRVEELVT